MSVSRLDENGDWTFGQGLANYVRNSEEVSQSLVTRLKSFANDWFLDTRAEIDWFNILGNKNNEEIILREVERVARETDGVKTIDALQAAVNREDRTARIDISYTDIFNQSFQREIGVINGS